MTLREGKGVAQTVRVPSYGEGGWPNCHIYIFYSGWKSLINSSSCVWGGGGLGEKRCGGGGGRELAENIRIPSYGRRGL